MKPSRLAFLFALALPAIANAQEKEKKRAIVVPTELGGFFPQRSQWRYEYNRALENRLRSARFDVPREPSLSAVETACHNLACLVAIADAHQADLVVAARAINDEQRLTSYSLRVLLVERPTPGAPAIGRSREKVCDNCTEGQVRDGLATLLSATLANEPDPVVEPKIDPKIEPQPKIEPRPDRPQIVGPIVQEPVDPKEATREYRRRWIFRGTGIGLAALGVLGLGQGFAEVAHSGDRVVQDGVTYRRNTAKGQALFLTAGSAFVITGAILMGVGWWPKKKKDRKSVTLLPEVSPTGGHLQISGTF